jgi:arylsulfatase A
MWKVLVFFCVLGLNYSETKPNVLLILTDDQGYGDLSLHGNPHLDTPHLDKLGRSSVRFDRFFVNSVCAPSRASILTGRYAVRTGVFSVTRNGEAIKPSEVTLGEAFKSADYQTAYFGKWHNGSQYPSTPIGQGFDEFLGFTAGHINNYFDAELLRGSQPVKTKGYITDVLTDEAINYMKDQSEPFFCYLSYNAPHGPYQVPDSYYDKFNKKGFSPSVAGTWAMCENIDDNIGKLMYFLEKKELINNTIVLFLTDNGATSPKKIYNAGMKGGKTSTYEGGSRVPLFVHWPKANWGTHIVEELTAHIDLFPTLMDLCGIQAPKGPQLDGISLRPLLEGSKASWPERILYTHNGIDEKNKYPGAVRTKRYRLSCLLPGPNAGSAAKNLDHKVKPWELYDIIKDPGQKKNLAKKMPEKVLELSRLYDTWIEETFSDGRSRMPLPVGYAEHNPVSLHASQSYFDKSIRYESGRGFAHDWLTGWTNPDSTIWFDVHVVQEGNYEISLDYACLKSNAGVELKVSSQDSFCKAKVKAALSPEIELPHRDSRGKATYRDRAWGQMKIGNLKLSKGRAQIKIEANQMVGDAVIDFKALNLNLN